MSKTIQVTTPTTGTASTSYNDAKGTYVDNGNGTLTSTTGTGASAPSAAGGERFAQVGRFTGFPKPK